MAFAGEWTNRLAFEDYIATSSEETATAWNVQ
jgi:hypothetical protein